ncbi:MAG: hypothetical protein A3A08_00305 [Candidatus Nealsonbacteria bacterium RIFCSPLOWO2_01_FULL_41_9]|uniref:Aminoacyl-tRNA hydrolase n=1 Tax=Candidatus Nealsonbacteria bacterium RIFCSPLOWO2_01_FULL_41_9 TaxID=1801671 RepID=A0A1G2ECW1_9BACT|nr:MAG: hypothetical protein A3A08_00305 [Candidatus Nealsonbacteria bacterium RIFCSPLOWO2_01_FULL_41_9]
MILIVGLGNPGKKYEKTRHNIGSRVVGELEALNLQNIILAKPSTFMNESGKAVKRLIQKSKIKIQNLIVVHDDIDIPLGEFKIQKNSGSAGHKGVESIIKELGTKNFHRIRIGICPETGKPKQVDKFVLQNFTKVEEKILKGVIKIIIEKINEIII